jgi:lipoprotein-releasing system permease protein
VKGNRFTFCNFALTGDKNLIRDYKDDAGLVFGLNAGEKTLLVQSTPGRGSSGNYISTYELMVDNWEDVDALKRKVAKNVEFRPELNQQVQVRSIKDHQRELFVWLGFLDINMGIILLLMLIIGIINMGSALLVMILVRTNFIGIMKAMGATNWAIRKLFIVQAGQLILKGMIYGNIIGIGFCLIQHYFGVLSLDPKVYYLTKVPIDMNVPTILGLNAITLLICLLALLLPSVVITRVSPAKAIRFR